MSVQDTSDRPSHEGKANADPPKPADISRDPTMMEAPTADGVSDRVPAGRREEGCESLVGTVIANRYRITRPIGTGGFGAVLEAEDTKIKKRVAVKVLTRDLLCDPAVITRFRKEAEAASQVTSYISLQLRTAGRRALYARKRRTSAFRLFVSAMASSTA